MSETGSVPISDAELDRRIDEQEKKPISQEILDKFSKGNIQVTDRATIKGEGEERKLHIRIKWNDPNIALSNNDAPIGFIKASRKLDNPELKTKSTDFGLDLMVLNKQMFVKSIFHDYVSMPLSKKFNDIYNTYHKIKNGSRKAEEQKGKLELQLGEIGDLRTYIDYLQQSDNAIAITIEEKPNRLLRLTRLMRKLDRRDKI